jgi:hypothetical protein
MYSSRYCALKFLHCKIYISGSILSLSAYLMYFTQDGHRKMSSTRILHKTVPEKCHPHVLYTRRSQKNVIHTYFTQNGHRKMSSICTLHKMVTEKRHPHVLYTRRSQKNVIHMYFTQDGSQKNVIHICQGI